MTKVDDQAFRVAGACKNFPAPIQEARSLQR